MRIIRKSSKKKAGLKPGSIVYVGDQRTDPVEITVINYDTENYEEKTLEKIEDCFPYKDKPGISWINVCGIYREDIIEKIGNHFDLHPLVMEDIVNTGHRPKLESTDDYIFVVLKMLYKNTEGDLFKSEQVSIFFTKNVIITFQEKKGDVFDPVRHRLKKTVPRSRFLGPDYLAYSLIDAIVDNYFFVMEEIGDQLEELEDVLMANPTKEQLETIHTIKRELIFIRKAVWPLREVIGGLDRIESQLVNDYTHSYLRDLYEHVIQVIDTVETFRDMVSGLLDVYLSSISNRMNEVMKVLTIIATIFIPLGFLAGVYGMNFDTSISPLNMPELSFRYGYIFFWSLVCVIGFGLVWFFRRKNWL